MHVCTSCPIRRGPWRRRSNGLTSRIARDSLCAELSKGLKQRVALARALLHEPPVVLLDEPTSGLDPQSARLVRDLVLDLRARGHAVVLSTHNLYEAERARRPRGRAARPVSRRGQPGRPAGSACSAAARSCGWRARRRRTPGHSGLRRPRRRRRGQHAALRARRADQGHARRRACAGAAGAAVVEVTTEDAPLEDVYFTLVEGSEPAESEAR